MKEKPRPLIVINTGEGKGKTTAALGMVLRHLVNQWPVAIVQFQKNPDDFKYGEQKLAEVFPELEIHTLGAGFTWNETDESIHQKAALNALKKAEELIFSGKFKMVFLDEIIYSIHFRFLEESRVIDLIQRAKGKVHLLLTGRYASESLIAMADLVTEMKNIKHPYEQGIPAQKGIEW